MQIVNFFCNFISLIAAVITICAAINSRKMLSELDKYKRDLYKKQGDKEIVKIINKIKADIKRNLGINQNSYKSDYIINNLENLVNNDRQLQNSCNCFFSEIKTIKNITRDNVDYFFGNVDAILNMYSKGN